MASTGSDSTRILAHRIGGFTDEADLPRRIIFRAIALAQEEGNVRIAYSNDEDRIFDGDIEAFIATRQDYPSIDGGISSPANPAQRENPLDLNCREDCFLVFYLSGDANWQFARGGSGFTTKADKGGKYGNLTHVRQGGERIAGDGAIGQGCRLLFVRAKCRDEAYRDGFNLHLELVMDDDLTIPIILDPDVRHPGGSGA